MSYIITSSCIDQKDKSCIEECPVDCIYEGGRMLYINSEECIDCGACEPVCPTNAIYYEKDVPKDQAIFIEINRDFFNDKTNLYGGSKSKLDNFDHKLVENYIK